MHVIHKKICTKNKTMLNLRRQKACNNNTDKAIKISNATFG